MKNTQTSPSPMASRSAILRARSSFSGYLLRRAAGDLLGLTLRRRTGAALRCGIRPRRAASNPLARLDFFDLAGTLVIDDAPAAHSLDWVAPSTWRASLTCQTTTQSRDRGVGRASAWASASPLRCAPEGGHPWYVERSHR